MEKIKYCPNCRKKQNIEIDVCDCGFTFKKLEEAIADKVTLIGYTSKNQAYIFLIIGILILLTIPFAWISNKEKALIATIGLSIGGFMFIYGFINELKQPDIAIKIINDKLIYFFKKDEEIIIDLDKVSKVFYYPANFSFNFIFITETTEEHISYLLDNCDEVKKHILKLLKQRNIKIKKRYSSRGFY